MVYTGISYATCCIVKNGISCYNYSIKEITFMEEIITWLANTKNEKTLRLKPKYLFYKKHCQNSAQAISDQ